MPDSDDQLFGLLNFALALSRLGLRDAQNLGRAKAAWDYGLSRHEIFVLELIAEGLDNNEIAERTGIADQNTIKKQISSIFRKLGVNNRVQAAKIPTFYGFAGPPAPPNILERVNG